jgi:gas vesicle protein
MMGILVAVLVGAAAAYLLDPDRGRQRRGAIGDRASVGVRRLRFSQLGSKKSKVSQTAESVEQVAEKAADGVEAKASDVVNSSVA